MPSCPAELHPARPARPGQEPHPPRSHCAARRAPALHRRLRDSRQPLCPLCKRCRDLLAELRRRHAHRLASPRRALRRKARHARRHRCRSGRRSRSHQGRARRQTSPANSPCTTAFCPAPIAASSPSTSCPTSPAKSRSRSSTSCRKATCRLRATPCASRSMLPRLQRQSRGLHRARQNRHPAQRPHRLRDSHPLSRNPRRGNRHHRAGSLGRARLTAHRDSTIRARDRRAGRLLRARGQEGRQAQRRQSAPAHLNLELMISNAERRALVPQRAHRCAPRQRSLRRAARHHRQARA
jgi:hypothetical protein